MKVVDAHVLLYAVNRDATAHEPSRAWLDGALSAAEPVGFAWIVLTAFLRLSTHPGIHPAPLTPEAAIDVAQAWLAQPPAVIVTPSPGHLGSLRSMLHATGSGGNLVNDAHLAALALDYGATVVTYDNDFGRFPGVGWERPTA